MRSIIALLCIIMVTVAGYTQTNLWENAGNVGIGTTNPQYALDVNSTAIRLLSNSYRGVTMENLEYPNQGALIFSSDRTGYTFTIGNKRYSDGNIQAIISMYDYGNVGIGTKTPWGKLSVTGSSSSVTDQGILQVTTGTGENTDNKLLIGINDGGYSWIQAVKPGDNYKSLVINPIGGKVGIGTTAPSSRLTIAGSSQTTLPSNINQLSGNGIRIDGDVGNVCWDGITYQSGGGGGAGIVFGRDGGYGTTIGLYTNDLNSDGTFAERLSITRGGNIGIGTTSPSEKLSVNGKIRAKEVVVETANWSDHVFADSYKLQPLAEVEQHIKNEKHLPGVPSAQEVGQKGVSIGDMQAILLAKIEELTLHQIAQEKIQLTQAKMINDLQAKLQVLETENSRLKTTAK
ncbi:MAG: hypothetical protein QM715_08305 [Nibricoccus sp.]